MSRASIQKKSTWIDMTPFVDVAFLILTFFILVTNFKAEEAVEVKTPSSVSSQEFAEKNNTFLILFDNNGAVHVQLSKNLRDSMFKDFNTRNSLGMNADLISEFQKSGAVDVPLSRLAQVYALPEADRKQYGQKGIPMDSLGGELTDWIRQTHSYTGGKANFYIKGDNAAKYPKFKDVLKALKLNDIYKFNLVTSTEPIPSGSALDISNQKLNNK